MSWQSEKKKLGRETVKENFPNSLELFDVFLPE